MTRKLRACFIALVGILASRMAGQTLSLDLIKQQLLTQPPQAIVALQQKLAAHGKQAPINAAAVLKADFDGNGSFSYVIAFYSIGNDENGFLRVFKQHGASLILAGDVGGYGAQFSLVDVNGDGVPEIQITSTTSDGRGELFTIHIWTGSSLHNMLALTPVEEGSLYDVYGDGNLEVVTGNVSSKGYDVYKPVGTSYKFFKTYTQDPTGLIGADGKISYVRAFCKKLEPRQFAVYKTSWARQQKSQSSDGDDTVHLRFGGLEKVNGGAVDVNQVDPKTVMVSPHVKPENVSIHARGDGDDHTDCAEGHRYSGNIRVEVARADFLKALQKLHPNGPLAAGDEVEVKVTAKLNDGTPVWAVFKASIIDDKDDKAQNAGRH